MLAFLVLAVGISIGPLALLWARWPDQKARYPRNDGTRIEGERKWIDHGAASSRRFIPQSLAWGSSYYLPAILAEPPQRVSDREHWRLCGAAAMMNLPEAAGEERLPKLPKRRSDGSRWFVTNLQPFACTSFCAQDIASVAIYVLISMAIL